MYNEQKFIQTHNFKKFRKLQLKVKWCYKNAHDNSENAIMLKIFEKLLWVKQFYAFHQTPFWFANLGFSEKIIILTFFYVTVWATGYTRVKSTCNFFTKTPDFYLSFDLKNCKISRFFTLKTWNLKKTNCRLNFNR